MELPCISIFSEDPLLGSDFEPCSCPEPYGTCRSCVVARKIEEQGKDWATEAAKHYARKRKKAGFIAPERGEGEEGL